MKVKENLNSKRTALNKEAKRAIDMEARRIFLEMYKTLEDKNDPTRLKKAEEVFKSFANFINRHSTLHTLLLAQKILIQCNLKNVKRMPHLAKRDLPLTLLTVIEEPRLRQVFVSKLYSLYLDWRKKYVQNS